IEYIILIKIYGDSMSFHIKAFALSDTLPLDEWVCEETLGPMQCEKPSKPTSKRFIRPMDLAWFLRARAISPMGAVVACCLWYRYGLERKPTIKVTRHKLAKFGIGKSTSRRLLCQMEEAHLISVQWHKTRAPEVTLLLEKDDGQ